MTRLTTVPFIHAPVQSTSSHVTLPTEPQSGKDMDYPSFRWGHRLRCFYLQNKSVVTQLCLTLCDPMGCSPPGSSAHGVLQARILEWAAMSFSRGSSRPRDWNCVSCIGRWILYCWATREVPRIKQSFITKPWAQLLASEFSGAGRKLGEQWS